MSSPAADYTPLFVGLKRGIFKKHGLDIKIQYILTGSGLMAAVTSGQVDARDELGPGGRQLRSPTGSRSS